MTIKLKGLSFSRGGAVGYYNSSWPNEYELRNILTLHYSEEKHTIILNHKTSTELASYSENARAQYTNNFPDKRQLTTEEEYWWEGVLAARKDKKEKAADRREFEKWVFGSNQTPINDVVLATRFLNGAEAGGGTRGLHIVGSTLQDWGELLLYRIGEKEFLQGPALAGMGTNCPASASRVAAVCAVQTDAILWPTAGNIMLDVPVSEAVLNWCISRLRLAVFKWVSARNKEAYEGIFEQASHMVWRVKQRWPDEINEGQMEMIKVLTEAFKDKKATKGLRAASLLQHKMETCR